MKLHQLRALVAIADSGSIRNAARNNDYSPAAITKAVRELEEEVGVTLIIRETTGITLTQAGQVLLEHARFTLGAMSRAREDMEAFASQRKRILKLAVPSWFGMTLLVDIMARFQDAMPETQLELFESFPSLTLPKLRDGTLDLSIGRSYAQTPIELSQLPLFSIGYAVVARIGHPLAACRTLDELSSASWILSRSYEGEDGPYQAAFQEYCERYAPRIHITHSSAVATSLIARTDLLSLMPWPMAELLIARDGLCVLPIRDALAEAEIMITHRRGIPLSAPAKCFIESTMSVIRESQNSTDPEKKRFFHTVEVLLKDSENSRGGR
nr:LysR family transcriptional regulator [uncultured Cupriavidus sp.]